MRMGGPQLGGVLDDDQPLAGVDLAEQRREQRGLAGAGAAADQERQPRRDQRRTTSATSSATVPEATSSSRVKPAAARDAQRDHRAGPGHRREHGMEPGAVGQPQVDVRRRVVEPPTTERGQPLGEPTYGLIVGERDVAQLESATAVEVDLIRRR